MSLMKKRTKNSDTKNKNRLEMSLLLGEFGGEI